MGALLLLIFGLALSPSVAARSADPSALLQPLRPSSRVQLVEALCAPEASVTAEDLAPLMHPAEGIPSDIDAARIAACRQDPTLLPFMLTSFLQSWFSGGVRRDPDVFTRLLGGLQTFSRAELQAALPALDADAVVELSWGALRQWMGPLSGGELVSRLDPAGRERAREQVRSWLARHIAHEGAPLARLQFDNGDAVWQLDEALAALQLAALLEWGEGEEPRVAAEVVQQRGLVSEQVLESAERRLAREPNPELAERLARWRAGEGRRDDRLEDRRLFVGTPEVGPATRSWEVPSRRRLAPGLAGWVLLGALGLLPLWLLALRRVPARRELWFRLAALALAPCGFAALELALALAGVRPLAELEPMFSPNQTRVGLYEQRELEGEVMVVSTPGDHRRETFSLRPAEGVRRVFTLGESSVRGDQYLAEETFSAVLERRLRAELGAVEVINAGVSGAVTDEILLAGLEVLEYGPDLLVLYCGYNDLTHFPMMGEYRGWSLPRLWMRRQLGRSRVARLVAGVLPRGAEEPDPEDAFLDPEPQSAAARDELLRFGVRNAEGNLLALAKAAQERGVSVLIATQAIPAYGCEERPVRVAADGCFSDELVQIAGFVAGRSGATLVQTQDAVRAHGPQQAPSAYFYDGVHPTKLGHAVLGEALAPTAAKLLRARR